MSGSSVYSLHVVRESHLSSVRGSAYRVEIVAVVGADMLRVATVPAHHLPIAVVRKLPVVPALAVVRTLAVVRARHVPLYLCAEN